MTAIVGGYSDVADERRSNARSLPTTVAGLSLRSEDPPSLKEARWSAHAAHKFHDAFLHVWSGTF